jgi:nitrogen fixation/metabolism regulation signal transduction histidine kinase
LPIKKRAKFERILLKYLLVATLVPAILLLFTLWHYQASTNLIVLLFLFLFCLTGFCASTLYQKITFQFRTLSNLLEGMSHGDYSVRGRQHEEDDALGQLVGQINTLADTLTKQRFVAQESELLVRKVIQHIDIAIIALDEKQNFALLNPAAEKLLNVNLSQVLHMPVDNIAKRLLTTESNQVVELNFANGKGKFQVIRDQYREHGHQHELFFISDVNNLLREHERQAWQNLIRVLSHEINNSLAPIASLSSTLKTISTKQKLDTVFSENLLGSLDIITERAKSLTKFVESYRRLSHLPEPQKVSCNLLQLINKVVLLFPQRTINVHCNDEIMVLLDPVQIEQVLINLIKNADEAMVNIQEGIDVFITSNKHKVVLELRDLGHGIKSRENLFTPFYTTKKQGSGIGLVLSRQIIEAHQGYLTLSNREDCRGCEVKIELPL